MLVRGIFLDPETGPMATTVVVVDPGTVVVAVVVVVDSLTTNDGVMINSVRFRKSSKLIVIQNNLLDVSREMSTDIHVQYFHNCHCRPLKSPHSPRITVLSV